MLFKDRQEAGDALGGRLMSMRALDPIVYALPRGGLPVAAEVAERLGAPLDVILVRKLGAPRRRELAIGAVVDGAAPCVVLNSELVRELGIGKDYVDRVKTEAFAEIERRRKVFAESRPVLSPAGRVVILIDDGLATGATMEAAVEAMRRANTKRVIVAVPTASMEAAEKLSRLADEVVFLETPEPFWSVGDHYRRFPQLSDADVVGVLNRFAARPSEP